jgi:hypothetical protein
LHRIKGGSSIAIKEAKETPKKNIVGNLFKKKISIAP